MNITNNTLANNVYTQNRSEAKELRAEEIQGFKDAHAQTQLKIKEESLQFTSISFSLQEGVNNSQDQFQKDYEAFQTFLDDIGYEGPAIGDLTQDEAKELVSEGGFFGVKQTSERIAGFVLSGAGNDESLLRAGREGILKGFDEAKAMSGGELPDISHETIKKAVEMIDKTMHEMGYSIINKDA